MIHLVAIAGIVIISFSAIFIRLASVSPVTATFFRAAYALPVLVPLWLVLRRRDCRTGRERVLAVVSGLILAVDLAIWHESIALIGAGLGTVIANVQVVFVAVAAWLVHGERPTGRSLALVAGILVGVVLTSGLARSDAYGQSPAAGALLGVVAGAAYAVFLLLFRAANLSLAPAPGPLLDSTLGIVVGALLSAVVDPGFSLVPTWPAHAWLALLALMSQVIGWLLIATALPRLPVLETSILLLGQPVGAVIWGVLLFSERLSKTQWLGTIMVLAGMVLVSFDSASVRTAPDVLKPAGPEAFATGTER